MDIRGKAISTTAPRSRERREAWRRSIAAGQRGIAAVEFALVMFVMLLIGAGIVEFGRAFWYYDALAKGTRDAARYLSAVPTTSLAGAGATARDIVVRAATTGGVPDFAAGNVSVVCAPTPCELAVLPTNVTTVTVGAQYPFGIGTLFPFIASPGGGGSASFAVTLAPHTTMPYLW